MSVNCYLKFKQILLKRMDSHQVDFKRKQAEESLGDTELMESLISDEEMEFYGMDLEESVGFSLFTTDAHVCGSIEDEEDQKQMLFVEQLSYEHKGESFLETQMTTSSFKEIHLNQSLNQVKTIGKCSSMKEKGKILELTKQQSKISLLDEFLKMNKLEEQDFEFSMNLVDQNFNSINMKKPTVHTGKKAQLEIKRTPRHPCGRKVVDQSMEPKLVHWIRQNIRKGSYVAGTIIRNKAKQFCSQKDFKASKGWLQRFIARYSLETHCKIRPA